MNGASQEKSNRITKARQKNKTIPPKQDRSLTQKFSIEELFFYDLSIRYFVDNDLVHFDSSLPFHCDIGAHSHGDKFSTYYWLAGPTTMKFFDHVVPVLCFFPDRIHSFHGLQSGRMSWFNALGI